MKWGEFWFADLDGGIGSEQCGFRPCIIVQNDIGNKYSATTLVCPVTTKLKNYTATHIQVGCLARTSYIMCEQLRVVDKSRLKRFICKIGREDEIILKEKLRLTLSL
jgi:mRNA interferase MazF